MTIEKGKDWGSRRQLAADAPIVGSDAELAALFRPAPGDARAVEGPRCVGLVARTTTSPGHDLARTVSARSTQDELRSGDRTTLPIDLAVVDIDGRQLVMAASLVIRSRGWFGPTAAAMNAAFFGEWNVAPRGHPNDGRLDIVQAELSFGDRLKARKRLPLGTHIPHPNISIRRLTSHTFHPSNGATVTIDGINHGRADLVSVYAVPDATSIVI